MKKTSTQKPRIEVEKLQLTNDVEMKFVKQ